MTWIAKHKLLAVLVLGAGGYYLWRRTQRQACRSGDSNIVNGVCMRTGFVDFASDLSNIGSLFDAPKLDDNGHPLITSPSQL